MTFIRTFLMVLLMEVGSSDQLVLIASSAHSHNKWLIWLAGVSALCFASALSILFGDYLHRLPISMNALAGIILLITGTILLVQR